MEEHSDQEDVDVFVSPKRFGGHTPAAKAIKQKVFEDNLKRAAQETQARREKQLSMESVQSGSGRYEEDYIFSEDADQLPRIPTPNTLRPRKRCSSESCEE
ncbi:hypothetical protein FGB62_17g217 [Gracilaria domingensis]|nr:hypothetical protein FGB62_17g217 [Gracilaria domingensis]